MTRRAALALLPLLVATPVRGATFLGLYSQPGDTIGGGRHRVLTEADGTMTAEHELGHVAIRFATLAGEEWALDFAALAGTELTAGTYDGAVLFPAQRAGAPGLFVGRNGRSCDRITGRFVVLVAEYVAGGTVTQFAATFEQRCNAASAPLYGTVSFGSQLPVPATQTPTPTPSRFQTFVILDSEPGDLVGGGRHRELRPVDGAFTATHAPGYVEIVFDGGGLNRWSFTFQAPAGEELVPGVYENARRFPFQPPIWPGLEVNGACNVLTGRFAILAADYGPDNHVQSFAANFELHCEGLEPALFGVIRFASDVPAAAPTPTPPTPTPTPERYTTYIHLESDPGDYVGSGLTRTLLPSLGLITAHYADGVLEIRFDGDEDWQLDFAAPRGRDLVPGLYTDVERYPFHSPARGGLDVGGNGHGCNMLDGDFVVFEAAFAADGSVERFAANFEQHCEHATAALHGWVRINSTLPIDAPTPTPPLATPTPPRPANAGRLYSDPGDYIGEGRSYELSDDDGVFTVTHESGYVHIQYEGGENSWDFHFAAPFGHELVPGAYELAQRWPFQAPRRPGLDADTVGRGCNQVAGRFEVLEADYGSDGAVERFAVDFEQRCELHPPALYGSLRIASTRPLRPAPAPTATPDTTSTYLHLSGGVQRSVTRRDGGFFAEKIGDTLHVDFTGNRLGSSWDLAFAPPACRELVPGAYHHAERWPFQSPGRPGFDINGEGSGCNTLDADFEILDLALGPDGEVLRFAADFQADCFNVTGSVRYTALLPTPAPTPTPPPFDLTSVAILDSDAGDYIGLCQARTLTEADGIFTATHDNNSVTVSYRSDAAWDFQFAAPKGQPLVPGTYEGATRYPFNSGDEPGLSVSGEGRGCNRLTGRFVVHEADLAADGVVEHFAGDFEQHCEGAQPVLAGVVRFNSTLPTPSPVPSGAPTRTPALLPCIGDCAGDGAVTVGDIVTGVAIALGNEPLDRCADLDTGHDGIVAINDLVAALNSALTGCVAVR